jgi:hypothetical protein
VRGLWLWIYGVGLGCGLDTDLGCVVGCGFRFCIRVWFTVGCALGL